jgi:small subunit ribosomal protein S6
MLLGFPTQQLIHNPLLALRQPARGGHDQREDCLHMTRRYEAVYIFDSTLEDAAINEKISRFHGLLQSPEEITLDHWGRRQLAYKIGPRETGYYVIAKFHATPTVLPEYERAMKLDDGVVRYLITLFEHEVGAPPMTEEEMARAARQDDDDDED